MWEKSATKMVSDMRHDKELHAQGQHVDRTTIFGTKFPAQSQVMGRSSLQKATLRACKRTLKEAKVEFEAEELEHDYSTSVKPVVIRHKGPSMKVAPRFDAAKLAIAKAHVSQKIAAANRSVKTISKATVAKSIDKSASGPINKSTALDGKSPASVAKPTPSSPSGSGTKRGSLGTPCSAAKRQHATPPPVESKAHILIWCSPEGDVVLPATGKVGQHTWVKVGSMSGATHLVIHGLHFLEQSSSGTAALHCKLYGKALLSNNWLVDQSCTEFRNYTNFHCKKGKRQLKFRLYISEACKDKHAKMYSMLLDFEQETTRLVGAKGKKQIYSVSVHGGGAPDVMHAIKSCKHAQDLKPIRWLMVYSEIKDCTLALSSVLSKPPSQIACHISTMTKWVDELGRVAA